MLSSIAAWAETSTEQLTLRLGLPRQPAQSELRVPLAEGALDLRLLDLSHQVVLEDDEAWCSELVARSAGEPRGGGLPARVARAFGSLDYTFRSELRRLGPEALAAEAARLVEEFRDQAAALVGVLPGAPSAVTVLAAKPLPGGVGWRTWHLFPRGGEVVTTASRVRRRG